LTSDEIILLLLGFISLITLPMLYWLFREPENVLVSPRRRAVLWAIVLAYAGVMVLALLVGVRFFSALFVAYPLFYLLLGKRWMGEKRPFSPPIALFIIPFFLLWFGELFAVLDYNGPILPHFTFYLGFYAGIALVFAFFNGRWQFSLLQLFTIGGLWGVLIEQNFLFPALFLQAIMGDGGAFFTILFSALFVFIIYGLYLAAPFLLLYERVEANPRAGKRPAVFLFIAIVIVPLLVWGVWNWLLTALGMDLTGVV